MSPLAASPPSRRLAGQDPEPLRRLERPADIEEEIRHALGLESAAIIRRASTLGEEAFSSECLVHLARLDLRGSRQWVEALMPPLLHRAERSLRRSLRGPWAEEACEETLGRLALLLLEPGVGADFFEVRFDLALKRLRIDVCRRLRRRPQAESLDGMDESRGPESARIEASLADQGRHELSAEEQATLSQALSRLPAAERQAMVLRHLVGLPVASGRPDQTSISSTLGVSERTVRNLLQRAKQRLLDSS